MNETKSLGVDNRLLGKAIARFRLMRGLTQAQLNQRLGMSTIQYIEQGRNTVSLLCLNKIASALDIPAACIVLLGTKVGSSDQVLSSLQALLEQTLSLQSEKATKPGAPKAHSQIKREMKKGPIVKNSRKATKARNAIA